METAERPPVREDVRGNCPPGETVKGAADTPGLRVPADDDDFAPEDGLEDPADPLEDAFAGDPEKDLVAPDPRSPTAGQDDPRHSPIPLPGSTADLVHGTALPAPLKDGPAGLHHRCLMEEGGDLCVRGPGPQGRKDVHFSIGADARPEVPVSGYPQAVAPLTEAVAHRGDDADSCPVDGPIVLGRLVVRAPRENGRIHHAVQPFEDLIPGDVVRPPIASLDHGHEFDEADDAAMVAAEINKRQELVVVHAAEDDRVDLYRGKPGQIGRA